MCARARLTLAVLGVHSVSIVTGLTDLAVWSSGVEQAPQTLPCADVTVPRLTNVHVTVTVTAHTGAACYLWVTMETTGTPKGTERGVTPGLWLQAAGGSRGCCHLSQVLPV